MSSYYVYILASGKNGTLYVGVTNDLIRRIQEHKQGLVKGFTKKHKVDPLVYYEETEDISSAIEYEKRLKSWNRNWKIQLIEKNNLQWKDLYEEIVACKLLFQRKLESTIRPGRIPSKGRTSRVKGTSRFQIKSGMTKRNTILNFYRSNSLAN